MKDWNPKASLFGKKVNKPRSFLSTSSPSSTTSGVNLVDDVTSGVNLVDAENGVNLVDVVDVVDDFRCGC